MVFMGIPLVYVLNAENAYWRWDCQRCLKNCECCYEFYALETCHYLTCTLPRTETFCNVTTTKQHHGKPQPFLPSPQTSSQEPEQRPTEAVFSFYP